MEASASVLSDKTKMFFLLTILDFILSKRSATKQTQSSEAKKKYISYEKKKW